MESPHSAVGPLILGLPLEFVLFGLVLAGVVVFHKRPLEVAWVGLALIVVARLAFSHFDLVHHLAEEWAKLVNLFGLLVGFGSSAGVAVSGLFPEARSVTKWLRHGWSVPVAFVVGYFICPLRAHHESRR